MRLAVLALISGCGRLAFDDRTFDASPAHDVAVDAGRIAPVVVAKDDVVATVGATITSSLPNVVAGHLIVLAIGYDHSTDALLQQVTSSSGDSFTILGPANGGTNRQYLAYGFASTTGAESFTATLGTNVTSYLELRSHEYMNVDPADPLDQYVDTSGAAPIQPNATLVTTTPNDALFAFVITQSGSTTAGAGFNALTTMAGDITEDAVAADPGSHQVDAVIDMGSWTVSAAAIRGY